MDSKPLVVIAEDDEMTQIMIKTIVDLSGFRTLCAYSGRECLEIIKREKPNLILMDLMMPEMDGLEAIKNIKKMPEYEHIPVIFLTAVNDIEILRECFDSGAADFVLKPFRNHELIARLNAALRFSKKTIVLKEKKENIQSQNSELKKIDEAKDDFITTITHDFKTPLTGIRSIAEMMLDNNVTQNEKDEYLKFIITQVDAINDMIHKTLVSLKKIPDITAAKLTMGNFKEYMGDISETYKIFIQSNGLDFEYKYDSNICNILFDNNKMDELFGNIISNAVKFTISGTISIKVYDENDKLFVTISDTGIGIPEDDLDKIFTKFYRANDHIHGNGLGLYIAKKIALGHNGDLLVKNTPPKGASFTLYLPLTQ